jgi:hypothetical protein
MESRRTYHQWGSFGLDSRLVTSFPELLIPVQPALFWLASAASSGFLSATGTRISVFTALTG